MGAGRVIGGIIALIGGVFIALHLFMPAGLSLLALGGNFQISWIINLVVVLLAVIGGILGLASKPGGALALIAGLMALVLPLIGAVSGDMAMAQMLSGLSGMYFHFGLLLFEMAGPSGAMILSIESVVILVGGIIMLVSSSD